MDTSAIGSPILTSELTCPKCGYQALEVMPRAKGDRPAVRPVGTGNLAFIGQYCEIPDDVVFTVEYSVRSAQIAVYSLLALDKSVSPLYKGQFDPAVLLASAKALVS